MLKFIRNLFVGRDAFNRSPDLTGALYLRDELRKKGLDPDALPPDLYSDLGRAAHDFAQGMARLSSQEQPVTYFVQHLDYILDLLQDVLEKRPLQEVAGNLSEIFSRHGVKGG